MRTIIETKRFLLREFVINDTAGLFELDSDPEVHRYLGNNPVIDKDKIVDVIRFIRRQYIDHGIGRWAIIEKGTENFMGWAGLKLVTELTNKHINYYDLGYRLLRKYWGQGIATECALASLKYGFEILCANEIFAAAHIDNKGSNKVLCKAGLTFVETFDYFNAQHNWYRIGRNEWNPKRSSPYLDSAQLTAN
jgi:ribosomal-protein-alanine N-acetyltransferase